MKATLLYGLISVKGLNVAFPDEKNLCLTKYTSVSTEL